MTEATKKNVANPCAFHHFTMFSIFDSIKAHLVDTQAKGFSRGTGSMSTQREACGVTTAGSDAPRLHGSS